MNKEAAIKYLRVNNLQSSFEQKKHFNRLLNYREFIIFTFDGLKR